MNELNFKLTQIGIVMLGATSTARSIAFYRDKLGLALKGQNEGFAFLDGGGVTLCLSESLARVSNPVAGATEVVFSVEDVRALPKWRAKWCRSRRWKHGWWNHSPFRVKANASLR